MSEENGGGAATDEGINVEGLKADLDKQTARADDFKSDMLKYKDENKSLAAEIAEIKKKLPSQDDLDLLQQAKQTNDDKKSVDEKWQKQVEDLKATYDKKLSEAEAVAMDAKNKFESHAIEAEIAKLTGSKVVDGCLSDVMALLKSKLDVSDGQVVVKDNIDPEITPEVVVNDFLKSKPYYLKPDHLQSGSGGKGQPDKAGDGSKAVNLAKKVAEGHMSPQDAEEAFWNNEQNE